MMKGGRCVNKLFIKTYIFSMICEVASHISFINLNNSEGGNLMSSILGLVRIAAVVGLSAIKVISTCLKVKEAKEQGVINPFMHVINNSNPYNRPMNNNTQCGSINMNQYNNTELRWRDNTCGMSRRYMNVVPTTTPIHVPVQPVQPVQSVYHPQPVCNYSQPVSAMNTIDFSSRRWDNNPVYQQMPQNVWTQHQYPNQTINMNQELQWKNVPVGGMYNYNNMNLNNTMYMNGGYTNTNELRWRPIQYQQGIMSMDYGGNVRRNWKPMFDWQGWLKWHHPYDKPGIVAMFYTDDGVPLFGPTSVMA